MIDVEMWFVLCKGVVFGMVLSVIIKGFGEWVRSRRTKRAAGFAPRDGLYLEPKGSHESNPFTAQDKPQNR